MRFLVTQAALRPALAWIVMITLGIVQASALAKPIVVSDPEVPACVSTSCVSVAKLQLSGDPRSLSTISELSLSGYAMTVSHWRTDLGLDKLMQRLAAQLPADTLAWDDPHMVYMFWSSENQSHYLTVTARDQFVSELLLSSVTLHQSKQTVLGSFQRNGSRDVYSEIKFLFSNADLGGELVIDLRDSAQLADGFSLLYSTDRAQEPLLLALSERLRSEGWIVETMHKMPKSFNAGLTIEANRFQHLLRMDIVKLFDKVFVYINHTRSIRP